MKSPNKDVPNPSKPDKKSSNEQSMPSNDLFCKKGDFSQVPNEILELLPKLDLTPTEFKICLVLIRELCGWDYKFKPIELFYFSSKTDISERHVSTALKNLVKKEIIDKRKVPGYRTPCYGFNEKLFGRCVVSKQHRKQFVDGDKVIDLDAFKLRKSTSLTSEVSEVESPRIRSQKTSERATTAASQAPKYPQIHINTLLKGFDKNNWEQVREHLLVKFPDDARRLDRTYRQIKERGYEQQGKQPFPPNNLPAWFYAKYEFIRNEYSFHDEKRA